MYKFSCAGDKAPGICAPLVLVTALLKFRGFLHSYYEWSSLQAQQSKEGPTSNPGRARYLQSVHSALHSTTKLSTFALVWFEVLKSLNTLRTGSFKLFKGPFPGFLNNFNPLNVKLNPICYLLALLAHHFLHGSRIRVKSLTLRLLMSYICSTYSWCF